MEACLGLPELLAAILTNFSEGDTLSLRSAALVNRAFRSEAERIIWKDVTSRSHQKTWFICGLISKRGAPAFFIRKLVIHHPRRPNSPRGAFSPLKDVLMLMPRLEFLEISGTEYGHLTRPGDVLPLQPPFRLHTFITDIFWDEYLHTFLIEQPTLFCLHLSDPGSLLNVPAFHPSFLPRLEDFRGALALLIPLMNSRTISRIWLKYQDLLLHQAAPYDSSVFQVVHSFTYSRVLIGASASTSITRSFTPLFPSLEELRIVCMNYEHMLYGNVARTVSMWLDEFSGMANIRTLHVSFSTNLIDGADGDAFAPHESIGKDFARTAHQRFPELCNLILDSTLNGLSQGMKVIWVRSKDSSWIKE